MLTYLAENGKVSHLPKHFMSVISHVLPFSESFLCSPSLVKMLHIIMEMLFSGGHNFTYTNVVPLNGFTLHHGREQPITRFDRREQNCNFMHNSL